MIILICFFLPPFLLLALRNKLLASYRLTQEKKNTPKEMTVCYFISVLLLNFACISITVLLFKHTGDLINAFQNATFTFHYLCMAIFLAIAEPVLEIGIRFHTKLKFTRPNLNIRVNWTLLLVLYTLIMFLMQFIRIFDNSFWGDEGYTIRLAGQSVREMISATAADVHPPLYYLIVQLLYHIGGNHGYVYHLSALIPYGLILLFSVTKIRKEFGYVPAIILVTCSSLMKMALVYNVEARMYSWGALFVLLAFYYVYRILLQNKWRDWAWFSLFSLCAAYTHYYALISVAFFYLLFLILMLREHKYIIKTLAAGIVTVIAYLPWFFVLLKSFERTSSSWWLKTIPSIKDCLLFFFDYKWIIIVFFFLLIIFTLYQTGLVTLELNKAQKSGIRLPFVLKDVNIAIGSKRPRLTSEVLWVIFGLAAISGTIGIGLLISYLIRPFFVLRYLFPVAPVAWLILGVCLSKLHFKNLCATIFIAALLLIGFPSYVQECKSEIQLDNATTTFVETIKPENDDMIITNQNHIAWTLLDYYYPGIAHAKRNDVMSALNHDHNTTWLFWTEELDAATCQKVLDQGFSCDYISTGKLGNGTKLFVYKLSELNQ